MQHKLSELLTIVVIENVHFLVALWSDRSWKKITASITWIVVVLSLPHGESVKVCEITFREWIELGGRRSGKLVEEPSY